MRRRNIARIVAVGLLLPHRQVPGPRRISDPQLVSVVGQFAAHGKLRGTVVIPKNLPFVTRVPGLPVWAQQLTRSWTASGAFAIFSQCSSCRGKTQPNTLKE